MYKVLVVGLLVCFLQLNYATAGKPVGHCEDGYEKCPEWKKLGDCNRIPQNMNILCRKSCDRCHLPFTCEDNHKDCKQWAQSGDCLRNPNYMRWFCRESCDTCNMDKKRRMVEQRKLRDPAGAARDGIHPFMSRDSVRNIEDTVDSKLPGHCEDGDDKCPEWKKLGDCNRIPQNMNILCRKSCDRCHLPFTCEDIDKDCKQWAQSGECTRNPNYMRWFCRESCDTCNMDQKRRMVLVERTPADAAGVDPYMSPRSWEWVWAAIGCGSVLGIEVLIIIVSVRKYHCISLRKTLHEKPYLVTA